MEFLKLFFRYAYVYKTYGIYLFIQIYIFKKRSVKLKNYGSLFIRGNTTDAEIFTQIFIYRQYEYPISGKIKTIIDLGGNNGMSARLFYTKYPEATIYVLEPDKNNFQALLKQVQGRSRIIPINKAIWKENGYVNLCSSESWSVKVDMNDGTNPVEAITISELLDSYKISRVDLLKIDIESSEKEVFESDTNFLSVTDNLIIELHDWIKPGCAASFFRAFNDYTYDYVISRENTYMLNIRKRDNVI